MNAWGRGMDAFSARQRSERERRKGLRQLSSWLGVVLCVPNTGAPLKLMSQWLEAIRGSSTLKIVPRHSNPAGGSG